MASGELRAYKAILPCRKNVELIGRREMNYVEGSPGEDGIPRLPDIGVKIRLKRATQLLHSLGTKLRHEVNIASHQADYSEWNLEPVQRPEQSFKRD